MRTKAHDREILKAKLYNAQQVLRAAGYEPAYTVMSDGSTKDYGTAFLRATSEPTLWLNADTVDSIISAIP